jgi:hypothetical protein
MGRKPKHDRAMTPAEKSREYRLRKKEKGESQIYFSISGEALNQIDELVTFFNLPGRAEVVSDLLKFPLIHALRMMGDMKSNNDVPMIKDGDSDESDFIKELKIMMWKAIVEEPSDDLKAKLKAWEKEQQ